MLEGFGRENKKTGARIITTIIFITTVTITISSEMLLLLLSGSELPGHWPVLWTPGQLLLLSGYQYLKAGPQLITHMQELLLPLLPSIPSGLPASSNLPFFHRTFSYKYLRHESPAGFFLFFF